MTEAEKLQAQINRGKIILNHLHKLTCAEVREFIKDLDFINNKSFGFDTAVVIKTVRNDEIESITVS